jgi:ribosomal protein L12E/L44/L45/RPP1/RPP2
MFCLQSDGMEKLIKAAGLTEKVESYWPKLYASTLNKMGINTLILAPAGTGGGGGGGGGSGGGGGGGDAEVEEPEPEPEEEEAEVDMSGGDMFGGDDY